MHILYTFYICVFYIHTQGAKSWRRWDISFPQEILNTFELNAGSNFMYSTEKIHLPHISWEDTSRKPVDPCQHQFQHTYLLGICNDLNDPNSLN